MRSTRQGQDELRVAKARFYISNQDVVEIEQWSFDAALLEILQNPLERQEKPYFALFPTRELGGEHSAFGQGKCDVIAAQVARQCQTIECGIDCDELLFYRSDICQLEAREATGGPRAASLGRGEQSGRTAVRGR